MKYRPVNLALVPHVINLPFPVFLINTYSCMTNAKPRIIQTHKRRECVLNLPPWPHNALAPPASWAWFLSAAPRILAAVAASSFAQPPAVCGVAARPARTHCCHSIHVHSIHGDKKEVVLRNGARGGAFMGEIR